MVVGFRSGLGPLRGALGLGIFIVMANAVALPTALSPGAAPGSALDYAESTRFLKVPLAISREGKVVYKKHLWKSDTDPDGTELLNATKIEARAAILKNKDGSVEALISYALKANSKGEKSALEEGRALYFDQGRLAAVTVCDQVKAASELGRVCVTATAKLCGDLRTGQGVDARTLARAENYETRTLSSLLTLRGSDHQLDNLLKSGNRLGMKSGLQTTRGQLMILARQVAKELGKPVSGDAEPSELRTADAKKIAERAKEDDRNARAVLEHTLPVLKASCTDARF